MRGVFSSVFCDFGPEFVVHDSNGEEPEEIFIGDITKVNKSTVTLSIFQPLTNVIMTKADVRYITQHCRHNIRLVL